MDTRAKALIKGGEYKGMEYRLIQQPGKTFTEVLILKDGQFAGRLSAKAGDAEENAKNWIDAH